MNCPNCKGKTCDLINKAINFNNAILTYVCDDCRATFTVSGKVSFKWGEPTVLNIPPMTIQDALRRLKRGPLRRQDIPNVLFQAMLDKGLVRESGWTVLLKGTSKSRRKTPAKVE